MGTFTDNAGRTWRVALDAPAIGRVRERSGLDLAASPGPALMAIGAQPVRIIETLWNVCEPQAQAAGVEPGEFGRALAGVIRAAGDALLEAVIEAAKPGLREQRRRLALRAFATARP